MFQGLIRTIRIARLGSNFSKFATMTFILNFEHLCISFLRKVELFTKKASRDKSRFPRIADIVKYDRWSVYSEIADVPHYKKLTCFCQSL